jgi:hypothetical protein
MESPIGSLQSMLFPDEQLTAPVLTLDHNNVLHYCDQGRGMVNLFRQCCCQTKPLLQAGRASIGDKWEKGGAPA